MASRRRNKWSDGEVYNDDVKQECNRSCTRCGRVHFIPAFVERKLCKSCGRYIYHDRAKQFQYDLQYELDKLNKK